MKKIIAIITTLVLSLASLNLPAMATSELTTFGDSKANILTGCANADKGHGEGIICVISFVVDILSIGVGVLGVIGISIVGIQYLTAGGNEEQTRKAKRRMFEIIIGLAVYAVLYALLKFLLPGFDESGTSGAIIIQQLLV